jgi:adenylate cyclase
VLSQLGLGLCHGGGSCQRIVNEERESYETDLQDEVCRAWAVVGAGTEGEKRVPVVGRLVIGRECAGIDEAHRLVLDDPTISRHHLEIRAEPDLGGVYAVDMSANGTRLNGTRIERAVLVPLAQGDRLQIGEVELRFEVRTAPARGRRSARTTMRRHSQGPMAMVVGDIVGYSRISEANDSSVLTEALDTVFGELRTLLRRHGGMLANFAGDAFFAAWELDSSPDAAARAVDFALAAAERVSQLAPELPLAGGAEFRMGWGVTVGEATVSVLTGALTTVVGDAANLAFRLSGIAAREGRSDVLVLEDAAAAAAPGVLSEAERISVKGRAEPVTVCSLRLH